MPQRYQYDALPEAGQDLHFIRLVTLCPGQQHEPLKCGLKTVQIGLESHRHVAYEALSYHWGDPTAVAAIIVNEEGGGAELSLHQSLYDAFIGLRSPTSERTLWTDMICINQSNVDERTAQVRIMHKIYRAASNVVVWLAKPRALAQAWNPKTAFQIVEWYYKLSQEQPDMAPLSMSRRAMIQRALTSNFKPRSSRLVRNVRKTDCVRAIFNCAWFGRMWIIQEVSCARKAYLICDDGSSIDFGRFVTGLRFATEKRLFKVSLHTSMVYGGRGRGNTEGWSAATQMGAIRSRETDSTDGILQYLNRFSVSQCSDPRDKVFALYGISELPYEKNLATAFSNADLRPDYRNEVSNLYVTAAKVCMSSGSLNVLSRSIVKSRNILNLPSWTPDWSTSDSSSLGSLAATGAYRASAESTASPCFSSEKTCKLEGILVGTIDSSGVGDFLPQYFSGFSDAFRGRIAWATFYAYRIYQLIEWEVSYHPSSATYPHTGEPFSAVSWGLFTSSRLSYEKKWFQSGLQTPNRTTDEKLEKKLKELYEQFRVLGSTTTMQQLMRPGLLWRAFVASNRAGHLVRFGMYEEEIIHERTIFASSNGYFGTCPVNAAVGDTIAILKGSKVPLILRQKIDVGDSKVFTLIGDAYVHGMMQGEMFDENACESIVLE